MKEIKMQKRIIFFILILLTAINLELLAQRGDPTLLKMGKHTGNRIGISFYNDGQVAGFNQGIDIRGEWPLGSGENYIGDCIPLIGVEFINKHSAIHLIQLQFQEVQEEANSMKDILQRIISGVGIQFRVL